MCPTTTCTADGAGTTTITAVHPDVIQSHILNRLDGAALASASCTSPQLLSLCREDWLWREICNSTWPSTADPAIRAAIYALPSGHRSLYSDCFPSARPHSFPHGKTIFPGTPPEFLISAVDIHYDGRLIHSMVLKTETLSGWFQSSPFRLDLLSPKETLHTPLKSDDDWAARAASLLRVSWILIDPRRRRAVYVAGSGAVEASRDWLTGELQLRCATVVDGLLVILTPIIFLLLSSLPLFRLR
ncbi:F-box family protein [Striga asiatica]|uniref:F-box family protein n=1 Tax=Striga asiatica TaxID=4170 RepID=A0A5A7PKQ5_STRAF|nr:F-box family protein [Striga asiatica]